MKMITALFISAAVFAASAALPAVTAMADYIKSEYDIEDINYTYEDGTGTVINGIDGSNAFQTEGMENIFHTSIDTTLEFYLGFDFCFDSENASIEIPQFKSNGTDVNKVGPIITYDSEKEVLRTTTANSGSYPYQTLGGFRVGEWYSAEIEGRTGMGTAYTTFRLYDSSGQLVQETPNFNMRNLGSENRSFNGMQAAYTSIDNVLLVQEKPDTITVFSDEDSINAGSSLALDYVMTRQDKEFNKYSVEWSVYNEDNTEPLGDDNITISSSGVLSAGVYTEQQTITVRATSVFGDKELHGAKQITVNSVDIGDEDVDKIVVSGPSTVKAGTSETYSFTASKNGEEVSGAEVVWSIYNGLGITENNNKGISIDDGVLTIDGSVIPQDITVRASTPSGVVYGFIPVSIEWADSQTETVLSYDACETEITNTTLTDSWDGSKAYLTSDSITYAFGDQDAYAITDVDIRFGSTDGNGLTLYNNNGSENSNIRVHGGALEQQTGSSNWDPIIPAESFDPEAWYHIEFLYLNASESGYKIYIYDDNGEKTLVRTMANCNRRNDKPYGKITFTSGLAVDNFKVALAQPDAVSIISPQQYVSVGGTAQYSVTASRNGLTMEDPDVTWSVFDSSELPIIDGSVTISENGLLSVDAMTQPQTIAVRASAVNGVYDTAVVTIQSTDIFTVTNIGVNEDKTEIVKLYMEKNFYYADDVTFIISVRSSEGALKKVNIVNTFGDRFVIGSNEVSLNFALPDDFDPESDTIDVMVWTTL